jgi:hypothetical protein
MGLCVRYQRNKLKIFHRKSLKLKVQDKISKCVPGQLCQNVNKELMKNDSKKQKIYILIIAQ